VPLTTTDKSADRKLAGFCVVDRNNVANVNGDVGYSEANETEKVVPKLSLMAMLGLELSQLDRLADTIVVTVIFDVVAPTPEHA
jgi:hypothetical protein